MNSNIYMPTHLCKPIHNNPNLSRDKMQDLIVKDNDIKTGSNKLDEEIQSWLNIDKNESTCTALLGMVKERKHTELEALLTKRMAFGTAGLRARMGPGYSCMNDVTVIQTSQGFGRYLLEVQESLVRENGVAIGFDARHNSSR